MAVSAYASLLSLTQFLDNLHYRAQFHIPRADINQVETLQEHVLVLLGFVERRSEEENQEIKALWRQIVEAAFEAENKINYHVVRQLQIRSRNFHGVHPHVFHPLQIKFLGVTSYDGFSDFCEDVERVIQKFHSIQKQLPTIKKEGEDVQTGKQQPGAFVPTASTATSSRGKGVVVGLDEHVRNVMDMLTRDKSNLQIFPIVGMGGIEKMRNGLQVVYELIMKGIELCYQQRFRSNKIFLPPHIWEMPQLRRILVHNALLSNPIPIHIDAKDLLVLKNLEMFSLIKNFKFTKEIFDRIPNIRKLDIVYQGGFKKNMELLNSFFSDLVQLQQLDSLSVCVNRAVFESKVFPNSLKQLSLSGYKMAWQDMSIIGSLPSLEKLELLDSMQGSEWNPCQGEFLRLKDLSISKSNLVRWSADQSHFPNLKHLELSYFLLLKGIPLGIGDILTLHSIRLSYCSNSALDSAKIIWEERQDVGNEITIDVDSYMLAYQIGPITARLTEKACVSLAYLKIVLRTLQELAHRSHDYLNTRQIETLKEDVHFLRDFVKVHCRWKSQELQSLSNEIVEVIYKTRLARYALRWDSMRGKNLPEDVERVLEMMDYIKSRLSMVKEQREDDQARYKSLQVDAFDNNARSYDIESLSLHRELSYDYVPESYFRILDSDTDLRYYQLGRITARMTGVANASWRRLAGIRQDLVRAAEIIGRHHLKTKQVETLEETIHFLQNVVEVHPESKSREMVSLGWEIQDIYEAAQKSAPWRSLMAFTIDFSDKDLLRVSEYVERVIHLITDLIKKPLSVDTEEGDADINSPPSKKSKMTDSLGISKFVHWGKGLSLMVKLLASNC